MDEFSLLLKDQMFAINTVWVALCAALIFFMEAGFAWLEAGFVRSKNTMSIIAKVIIDITFGGIAFFILGFGIAYGNSNGWFAFDIGIMMYDLDLDLTVPQYFNPLKLCEDMLSPPDGKETNDVIVDFLTDLMNILNKSYANKITIDGNMIAINNVIERSQYEMKVIQNKLESMLFLDSELSTSHIHKNEEIRHQLKSLPATRKISPLSTYFWKFKNS